ncbi:hypothetical protein EZS27_014859 [termite gut metagenome]|uniref:Uncharacterized protein n=1 Tax=termite gut metagenome TaxID=433724 RepID=A0A5J4RVP4_9ZZZZ
MKKIILIIILFLNFSCEENFDNDIKTPLKLQISNLSGEGEVTTRDSRLSFYSNLKLTAKVKSGFTGIDYITTFISDYDQINDGSNKLYYEDLLPVNKYSYSVETVERSKTLILDQSKPENWYRADYMESSKSYLSETKKALITNLEHVNVAIEINVSGIGYSNGDFSKFIRDNKTILKFITKQNDEVISYKMNYNLDNAVYNVIVPINCLNNKDYYFKLTNFNKPNETVSGKCTIDNFTPKAGDKIIINVRYNYKNNYIEVYEDNTISQWDDKGEWN